MGRIVSIDYGLAKIGLAITDERKIIASPLCFIAAKQHNLASIESILIALASYDIELIVVGMPIKLNGTKGTLTDEINHFIGVLRQKVKCPVVTFDERLTTLQAEKSLREGNLNRKKRSTLIDSVAASLILQGYLDCRPRESASS